MALQAWIEQGIDWVIASHTKPGPPPWWWLAVSALPRWVFGAIVTIRYGLYRWGGLPVTRLPVPVVSVGNVTTGGTGKTPLVMALANHWVAQGKRVVVLSRGYGARCPQSYARATNPDFGDEPYLIQQAVPDAVVIVGANRRANALRSISDYRPDVVILDDGFQYRGLARTVDIVLVDGLTGLGNGALLPTGPLREPLAGLQRAHCLWVTRWDGTSEDLAAKADEWQLSQAAPHLAKAITAIPIAATGLARWQMGQQAAEEGPAVPLSVLVGQSVIAVSGIARPAAFKASLSAAGARVVASLVYPDHHDYQRADFEAILAVASRYPDAIIVITAKDGVKWVGVCPPSIASRVRVLMIAPVIPPSALAQLDTLIDGSK